MGANQWMTMDILMMKHRPLQYPYIMDTETPGIGTALLKEMLLYMKMKGYPAVSLSVQKANYACICIKKPGSML